MIPFRPLRSLRPVRPRLPRRAIPWYAATVALALVTGATVTGAVRRANEAEAAYGTTRPVAVVAREVAAGQAIQPGDVDVRRWPTVLVPPGALGEAPVGRVALVGLVPGEAVVDTRLSGPGAEGVAALLAPEERAVPIPTTVPGLVLRTGDRVDVLTGGPIGGAPGSLPVASDPDVVAADATVLEVGEESVVVAVPARAAARVVAAVTAGPVVLTLRPPGG